MLAVKNLRNFSTKITHVPLCIIGGGSGGVTLLGHLIRQKGFLPHDARVFDPSVLHHYQPGWTMIGGGLINNPDQFVTDTFKMVKGNVPLERAQIVKISPKENTFITSDGRSFSYDHLVLSTGIKSDFSQIEGGIEALEDPDCPVASIYDLKYAVKMNKIAENFQGGVALFADPATPIKCAGSAHKIVFLNSDRWRKEGVKDRCEILKHKGTGVYFTQPKYAQNLERMHKELNHKVVLSSNLVKIDGRSRIAFFKDTKTNAISEVKFDLLHFIPPQPPHKFIAESGLGGSGGYVDVDQYTLQHKTYKNVWALGDNAGLPTSKTAAAIMSQSIVLMKNLMRNWKKGEAPNEIYNGYTSCPIFAGKSRLMLCEFKYNADLDETFMVNKQHVPRKIFYYIKRYMFPFVYFNFVPRGLWLGRKGFGTAFY